MPGKQYKQYTSDEQSLLIKYIAKYNPTEQGRAGNALYKKLCEDVDSKWKWSRTHPWQSWRDQYYRNREFYDRKIRIYQKKIGTTGKDDTDNRSASGDSSGNEDIPVSNKRKRGNEVKMRRLKVKREPLPQTPLSSQHLREEEEESSHIDTDDESEPDVTREGPVGSEDYEAEIFQKLGDEEDEGAILDNENGPEDSEVQVQEQVTIANRAGSLAPSSQLNPDVELDVKPLYPNIEDILHPEKAQLPECGAPDPRTNIGPSSPGPRERPSIVKPLYPDIEDTTRLEEVRSSDHGVPDPRTNTKPSLPSRWIRPSTAAAVNPQPEASSSKVQLSPSHRLPPRSINTSKTRRKREKEDEDFFGSPHPTPTLSLSETARTKHRLPRLKNGHFVTSFTQRRRVANDTESSTEDEKRDTWPPLRKRKSPGKIKGQAKESVEKIRTSSKASKTSSLQEMRPPRVADHASSSRVTRLSSPALDDANPSRLSRSASTQTKATTSRLLHQHHQAQPPEPLASSSKQDSNLQYAKQVERHERPHQLRKTSSSGQLHSPSRPVHSNTSGYLTKSSNLRHESRHVEVSGPRDSWTPGNPFRLAPGPTDSAQPHGKERSLTILDRRYSLGNMHEYVASGRRIDLRTEVSKRLHARSSLPAHTRPRSANSTTHSTPMSAHTVSTATSSARRTSLLPIPVAEEDREKIDYLGMSAAIAMIAENFGFREETVWRMWEFFKNIANTEEFCRRYRAKMVKTEDDVLAEMEEAGLNMDGLLAVEENEDERQPQLQVDSTQLGLEPSPLPPRKSPNKRELNVRLLPDDDTLSEYTPPYTTRAGQYVRLVNQGRKEEAIQREGRRASGGGHLFLRQRSASLTQDSPTAPEEVPVPEISQIPDEKEDENQEEPEEQEDSTKGTEETDSPSLEELVNNWEGDQPGQLSVEDAAAFLSANREKATDLRAIEQGMDIEVMLRWTAARLTLFRDRATPS